MMGDSGIRWFWGMMLGTISVPTPPPEITISRQFFDTL